MVLEPVGHSYGGYDIDSTGGLLNKVDELNNFLKTGVWEEDLKQEQTNGGLATSDLVVSSKDCDSFSKILNCLGRRI